MVLRGLFQRFWPITLGVVALCAYLAASATSALIAAQLIPERARQVRYSYRASMRPPEKDLSAVTARNIFCSSCDEVPAAATAAPASGSDGVKTTLPLQLVATLRGADRAFASIRDEEGRVGLYAVGDALPGDAELARVETQHVLLSVAGHLERLELEQGTPDEPQAQRAARPRAKPTRGGSTLPAEVSGGIRRLSGPRWEIRRAALNKLLGNTTLIARAARIVPSSKDGKPDGFRLDRVRRGGIYELLGLRTGDTVHAINGQPITSPDKALSIYTRLRTSSRVTMSFTRRGKPHTNEYIIRN